MAALAIIIATLAGWYTARYRRARADHQNAKAGERATRQILGVERRAFGLVAAIVIIIIWWWLNAHS